MALLDPNPPQFPAAWASTYGQDRFGLWQAFEINGACQVMRWIPPGRFMMGSSKAEHGRYSDETQHQVTISKGFYMADTACTQVLWSTVMGENPSAFKNRPENPVESVSWDDCQDFINLANKMLHGQLKLRLPSESEWEYAARGGSQTVFWWGNTITPEQAHYATGFSYKGGPTGEYRAQTVDVLMFECNDFGLFNVHGNVFEWCQDAYGPYPEGSVTDPRGACGPVHDKFRVLRGGGWSRDLGHLRAAYRDMGDPNDGGVDYGLRLAGG